MPQGIRANQFTKLLPYLQNLKKLQSFAIHGLAIMFVLGITVFSGQMTDYTNRNAYSLMNGADQGNANALTSAYVAANVAEGLGVNLASRVLADAENFGHGQQLLAASDTYLTKVSTITTDAVSRDDVLTYTVKDGDTVASIAGKFNITSNTVRWANNLADGDEVHVGDKLTILPVNGVLYEVRSGDTADKLAERYQANAPQIISFNDAELNGLRAGQKIVIPDGTLPASERPQTQSYFATHFTPQYTGNGYVYGYCTWYVASRINVPNNWGNAATWAYFAAASGWKVSATPTPGAIAQNSWMAGGLGHVGIVEEVSADGRQIKLTDMNGNCGWGCVGTAWVPASTYPSYITP